ncbi:MAG TPA: hypothetical protein VED37_09655, partial [Ktedonobacteraceae bacterium]|nr:hypothetical protein [Ktedonobacteraceae bacterium]
MVGWAFMVARRPLHRPPRKTPTVASRTPLTHYIVVRIRVRPGRLPSSFTDRLSKNLPDTFKEY